MAPQHEELNSFLAKKGLKGKEAILATKVTDIHAEKIAAAHCLKWTSLLVYLDFEDPRAKRQDIDATYTTPQKKREGFFDVWLERDDATYKALINALLHIGQRADAEFVCQLLLNDPPIPNPVQTEGMIFRVLT